MKRNKILLVSTLILFVFSCEKTKPLVGSIELEKWNKSTIDFALNDCGLKSMKYDSTLINEKGEIVDFNYDIRFILEKRKKIIKVLKSNKIFKDINSLKILENYDYMKENPSFSFEKKGQYYSCIFEDDKYVIKEEEGYDSDAFKLVNDSICMVNIKLRIANMTVISELKLNDSLRYKTLSLYIDSDFSH